MVTFYRQTVPFRVGKYAQTVRHRIPRRMGIILALAGTDFTRNLDTFLRTARDRTSACWCQTQNFIDADQSGTMKTTTGLEKFSLFYSAMLENPEPRALSSAPAGRRLSVPSLHHNAAFPASQNGGRGALCSRGALRCTTLARTRRRCHHRSSDPTIPFRSSTNPTKWNRVRRGGGGAHEFDRPNINTRKANHPYRQPTALCHPLQGKIKCEPLRTACTFLMAIDWFPIGTSHFTTSRTANVHNFT